MRVRFHGSRSEPLSEDGESTGPGEPHAVVENQDMIFFWKPRGWSMSVGKERQGADEVEREEHRLEIWLAEHWGRSFPIAHAADLQHGLLHRLDRDTSGLVAWAKTYEAYYLGRLQFSLHRGLVKRYLCVCCGHFPLDRQGCFIETSLRIQPAKGETSKRCLPARIGLPAKTMVRQVAHFAGPGGAALSLVEADRKDATV
ncbi:unnamed protein product [Durusdinium trenchii]|uniref:Pseudouridine synthase RsuA/RluA-like domain-containing protein n=1 Tax=Durusdinium trenchii TaxID=1381693 RepID=A0ABP0R154_9DINO